MINASFLLEYTDSKAFVVYWDVISKKYIHATVTHIRQYLDPDKAYKKSFKKTRFTKKAINNGIDEETFRLAISYLYTHQDVLQELELVLKGLVDGQREYTAVHRILPYRNKGALYFKIIVGKYSVYRNEFDQLHEFNINVKSLSRKNIPLLEILERNG